ncbi:MAG: acetyl-CoA carboxylase biotin carboxyl carrier protein subunit [Bacteroidales bacterium]|nr:acetyl-CoA carboxylase biotin carboxyl carrier protein subunit [Bacteroidales bacterium]
MDENRNNEMMEFSIGGMYFKTLPTENFKKRKRYEEDNPKLLKAFIPGTVVEMYVKPGSSVKAGEQLLILEAMKMRNVVAAPFDGKIKHIWVKENEIVVKNQLMIEMF